MFWHIEIELVVVLVCPATDHVFRMARVKIYIIVHELRDIFRTDLVHVDDLFPVRMRGHAVAGSRPVTRLLVEAEATTLDRIRNRLDPGRIIEQCSTGSGCAVTPFVLACLDDPAHDPGDRHQVCVNGLHHVGLDQGYTIMELIESG